MYKWYFILVGAKFGREDCLAGVRLKSKQTAEESGPAFAGQAATNASFMFCCWVHKNSYYQFIIIAILLQAICTGSFAQTQCGTVSIDSANYNYEIGRFKESIEGLSSCLRTKGGFNYDQTIQAYHILAKCYLAIDSVNSADSVIGELLLLKDNFEPGFGDPERFVNAVIRVRSKPKDDIVSSVSKRKEKITLAPATTILVTQAEILQRGYNDLIEVLKDLPGFDISTYYGSPYSNINQRGFRSDLPDKILILVDGVEDNDLRSYIADISQQYPIASIKQIEVVYGPASTMYGPNAFSGVINIITKEPGDLLHDGRSFGIHANAGIGSYNTKFAELNAGFKNKNGNFSCSVTGRVYYSDRPDLSSQKWWDYDPSAYDTVPYDKRLKISDDSLVTEFIQKYGQRPDISKYASFNRDSTRIFSTPYSDTLAENFDKAAYGGVVNGVPGNSFINNSKSYYVSAKFNMGDLNFGFVSWEKTEGNGTKSTDKNLSVNGTLKRPSHTYFYLDYTKYLSTRLIFSAFVNYRIHTLNNGSKTTELYNYDRGNLALGDIIDDVPSTWLTTYYYEKSKQFRSEFKLLYNQGENFNLISGVEIRNSELPGYLLMSQSSSVPQDYGTYVDTLPGGNQFDVNDIGLYSQATYRKNRVGFTLGARLDYDKIRQGGGLGFTLSPRAVVDYAFDRWVFKAIFSKGIEGVSNAVKYSESGKLIPNPELKTESIYNYEISVNKKFSGTFNADINFYYSNVQDVVSTAKVAYLTNQNINSGDFKIFGGQANFYYRTKRVQASFNYSYTHSRQTTGDTSIQDGIGVDTSIDLGSTDLKLSEIAPHKANVILNYVFLEHKDTRFNFNFRANYVDSKNIGPNSNIPVATVDQYIVCNLAIGAENILKGATIQFICNNIFNKVYYDPGSFREVTVLQMARNFSFRINYDF